MAAVQRFRGPVLPDGEARDLYVVDGRITYEPQAGAETVAEGWIVPGLVDAHCHVGMDDDGAVDRDETERQVVADRDGGALLIRDCGSAAETAWINERDDLPRMIRAGRHIARTKRYIRNYAEEVEPDGLAAAVAEQAQRGDGWVKLVGDWISRDDGDLRPSFPPGAFAEAIRVAHEHGAKVTAHCFGHDVLRGLIEAGIDCVEHGTGLTPDLVEAMVASSIALVPTVMQLEKFPEHAAAGAEKFPAYAETMTDLYQRRRDTIMAAHEAGVAIYAGSDGGGVARHGNITGEVLALRDLGLTAEQALGAASWRAREWLGVDGHLAEGAAADFLVLDSDPLEDLTVLTRPAAIVLRERLSDPADDLVHRLRAAGCVFAEEEAALLLAEASGDDLELMVERRVAGEPLEQVLGWAEFGGLRVRVVPGVFVPRTRTERVAELAATLAAPGAVVVDLCCGSGAIGAVVADRRPDVEVHAADLDPDAVACARLNLPADRVHEGDLFNALPDHLRGRVGVLAVNAPYVPTDEIALMPPEARLHEHHVALDGGPDGLELHRRVAAGAADWLVPGGSLLLETSPRQAADTAHYCLLAGLEVQVVGEDPVRVVRAISAAPGPSGTMTR